MNELETLVLYQGATMMFQIDLTGCELNGGKFVLCVREKDKNKPILVKEMTSADVHTVTIGTNITQNLIISEDKYEYDIMLHINGERFPQCSPSPVSVRKTVGGVRNGKCR